MQSRSTTSSRACRLASAKVLPVARPLLLGLNRARAQPRRTVKSSSMVARGTRQGVPVTSPRPATQSSTTAGVSGERSARCSQRTSYGRSSPRPGTG